VELRQELARAAASADIDRVYQLLERVSEVDPGLGVSLRRLIDNFEYEELQRRLEP
jgi:hypothetical protein